MLVALMLLLWTASGTPQELDLSLRGLEAAPEGLCSLGVRAANFCGNKLRAAPPCCSSFRRLYLYRNKIQDLPDDWLAECAHIEEVSVSANALRRLPPHLLGATTALRRLQASRNLLDSLPPRLLRNATSLRELDMSHNSLTELPHGFLDTTAHLVELFLQANFLRDLPEATLASCGGLQVLWLSHNRLTRLPKLLVAATPHLRTARLDHNLIEDIAAGAFDNNAQLRFLDLSSNRLRSLPTGLFRKATSLRRLLLAHNQLTVVPPAGSLPQQPAVIDLSYNLFQTVEDLSTFGDSRVVLDYNLWCHDLIPASQLSQFQSAQRHRWFQQRPVRYDRLAGRVSLTSAGLLNCGATSVARRDRVTSAAGARIDFNVTDSAAIKRETATESPTTSERIILPKTDIDATEDLKMDAGRVTFDYIYTTSASTMPGGITSVSEGVEVTSYGSTIDGNANSETTAANARSNILRTTQPETTASGYSELEVSDTPKEHSYQETTGNTSPELFSNSQTSSETAH